MEGYHEVDCLGHHCKGWESDEKVVPLLTLAWVANTRVAMITNGNVSSGYDDDDECDNAVNNANIIAESNADNDADRPCRPTVMQTVMQTVMLTVMQTVMQTVLQTVLQTVV